VKYKTEKDAFLYILVNAHWEEQTFTLPELPAGLQWHLACASRGICCPAGQETQLLVPAQFTLGPRETAVLIGK
jgi:glycogen operon protein